MDLCKCIKEADIASIKENLKILHKRVDSVENINDNLTKLTTSVAVMASEMESNNKKLDKLQDDVDCLKDEDSKNYKYYRRQIITWVVIFILGTVAGLIIK